MQRLDIRDKNKELLRVNPIWDGGMVRSMSAGNVLWDFDQLKVPKLWGRYGVMGEGVKAAVIDSGIDYNHIRFKRNPARTVTFIAGDRTNGLDGNGHGTWVCGKMGGSGIGIAPKIDLASLRTLDSNGSGYSFYTTNALEWVWKHNAYHVVNMSLGSFGSSPAQAKICKKLWEQGVIVIAAAGNEDTEQKSYPAAYDGVIAVAAIDKGSKRAWFSNYGDHILVSAPGVSCYSTYVGGGFRKLQGTSMASPTCAGLACLGVSLILKRKGLYYDRRRIRDIIWKCLGESATDLGKIGRDKHYGFGGINGVRFMHMIEDRC